MKIVDNFSAKVLANIIKFRNEDRITQADIAAVLEIDMSTYSKIESGKIALSIDRLAKIASFLKRDLIDVMYGPDVYVKCDAISKHNEYGHPTKVTLQIELNEDKKDKILEMIFEGKGIEVLK